MSHEVFHPEDLSFAKLCLERDVQAVAQLQVKYGPPIIAFLRKAGASLDEAETVVDQLWSDCLSEREDNRTPRLATYSGRASLTSWLKTLALNQLIRHVRQKGGQLHAAVEPNDLDAEDPLIEILRKSVFEEYQKVRKIPPQ